MFQMSLDLPFYSKLLFESLKKWSASRLVQVSLSPLFACWLQAVKCFGTNFELLSKLFPGRPRRILANKWRREMKVNPARCDEALEGGGGSDAYQRIVDALQEGEVHNQLL